MRRILRRILTANDVGPLEGPPKWLLELECGHTLTRSKVRRTTHVPKAVCLECLTEEEGPKCDECRDGMDLDFEQECHECGLRHGEV